MRPDKVTCARISRLPVHTAILFALTFGLISAVNIRAAVPPTVSYQGRLTTPAGVAVNNGTYTIAFRIYDDSLAGNLFWEEVKPVPVTNGLFAVQLGQTTTLDQSTLSMSNLFIATKVGSDAEMVPRTRLATVPYAFMVGTVDGATGGMVIGDFTATGQVTGTGVYGYNVPSDHNGVGGDFVGGLSGVRGSVHPTGSTILDYRGVTGEAVSTSPQQIATLFGVHGTADGAVFNVGLFGEAKGTSTSIQGSYYGLYASSVGAGANAINYGVRASAFGGSTNYGIYAEGSTYAAYLSGNVHVNGTLSKSGGSFKIDHPLDPTNKYLQHSFVESPDMMNIYNGEVTLDANGTATVTMPDWFQPLNRDFRYQLTAIGAPGPNLFISQRVQNNHFSIAGGSAGMAVSWQITGVRQDAWANANRIQVEVPKEPAQVGTYLHPELLGHPESMGESYSLSKVGDDALKQVTESNDRPAAGHTPEQRKR